MAHEQAAAHEQAMAHERAAAGRAAGIAPDYGRLALWIVAAILVGWAIRGLSSVLMPLTAAVLIALAVMPVRDAVAARLGARWRWVGVLAALGVVLLVLAAFVGALALAARQIVAEVPGGTAGVVEMVQQAGADEGESQAQAGAEAGAEGALDAPADEAAPQAEPEAAPRGEADAEGGAAPQGDGARADAEGGTGDALVTGDTREAIRAVGQRALRAAGGAAAGALNSALSVLGSIVLVLVLVLLVLTESGDWRRKTAAALPWPDQWRLRDSSEAIAQKMRAYLLIQTMLAAVSAALYAGWLGIWGIGLLFVWPLLIFVLNFIPTVGSLVGGTLPVAYTLMTRDAQTAVFVGLGILVIEQVMGNLVGPRVQGRNVALSPLVVLVALAFWGWAWGIAGALLAVPVTVALVVLGAHVPTLRPWALLLSNKTEWAGLDAATRPE